MRKNKILTLFYRSVVSVLIMVAFVLIMCIALTPIKSREQIEMEEEMQMFIAVFMESRGAR
jgi:hypothetical protein